MSSSTLNVARYTAVFSGVLYGWYHRKTLQSNYEAYKLDHAKHEREKLIADAKIAWKKQQESPKGDDGFISDPDDPRFDLEKLLQKWENAS